MRIGWGILGLFILLAAGCAQHSTTEVSGSALERGWNSYRLGEYDLAVTAFDEARASLPIDSNDFRFATYGLATTWNLRTPVGDQDKDLAKSLYEEVVASAPDSDLAAWSTLAMARMDHLVPVGEDPDYAVVRAGYEKVVAQYPDHIAGHEAFMYLQSIRVQTLNPDQVRDAADALEGFVLRYPESQFMSAVQALLSACYEVLKKPELQLAAEIRALDTIPVDASNPKVENSGRYWRIATIAEFEAGDFETARRFYRRLIDEYPQDIRIYASEQALKRMDALEAELGSSG